MKRSSSPDWGGNYPPGAKNDPRAPYNQPDRSHEHRWRPADPGHQGKNQPIIEDGAAIFHEQCEYAEGEYGEGWQCEETRTYRFEYSTLRHESWEDDKSWDVKPLEEWGEEPLQSAYIGTRVRLAESAYHNEGPHDEVSLDVDPDSDCGVVTLKHNGWELRFEP